MKPISAPTVAKAPNYTEAMIDEIVNIYVSSPNRKTVDELALYFRKTPRSIIAKLSNLGVYVTPSKVTKSGTPVVKKSTLVDEIASALNISVPSLLKANKQDLETLLSRIKNV